MNPELVNFEPTYLDRIIYQAVSNLAETAGYDLRDNLEVSFNADLGGFINQVGINVIYLLAIWVIIFVAICIHERP